MSFGGWFSARLYTSHAASLRFHQRLTTLLPLPLPGVPWQGKKRHCKYERHHPGVAVLRGQTARDGARSAFEHILWVFYPPAPQNHHPTPSFLADTRSHPHSCQCFSKLQYPCVFYSWVCRAPVALGSSTSHVLHRQKCSQSLPSEDPIPERRVWGGFLQGFLGVG